MNKRSHLFVTEKIVKNLPEEKRSWVLQYVEDFYTLAHNFVFEGGLPSHILYERQLEDYLKEEAVFSEKENKPADICYIYKAVQAVSSCLLRAIAVNEQESQEAEPINRFRLFG